MVVMETVRAATMATAKRRERLKNEQEPKEEKGEVPFGPPGSKGMSELAIPSTNQDSRGYSTPPPKTFSPLLRNKLFTSPGPSKRTPKNASSPVMPSAQSIPDSVSKHHIFFSPEKLQIVKPLEGSVTLLRWRLLASPQLGGAKAYFSTASPPGVQVKGWTRAGIVDTPPAEAYVHTSPPTQKQGTVGFADLGSLDDSSVTPLQTVAMTPVQGVGPLSAVCSLKKTSRPGFGTGSPAGLTNTSITDVQ